MTTTWPALGMRSAWPRRQGRRRAHRAGRTRRLMALTAHGLAAIDATDAGLTDKQLAGLRALAGSTGLSLKELRERG